MQVLLVLGVELGPDDFFKAVGFGVNEFGVLRDWQIGVPGGRERGYLRVVYNIFPYECTAK